MAREMKNSGVRWIGDIPKNWAMTKIKFEISDYKAGPFGSSLITDKLEQEGNILVYTPEHVALSSDTCSNNLYLPEARRFEMSQFFVKEGDIVFPIVGSLGRAMKINSNNNEGIINQRLAKFRLSSTRLKDDYFLWLFARSSFYSPYIDLYRRGTIILNLTKTIVGGMPIPLPPLSEQKVISDFLEAKCGEIDGLLEDLEAEVKTLTEYKKSIIAETVTHGIHQVATKHTGISWIGDIPSSWDLKRLQFCIKEVNVKNNPIQTDFVLSLTIKDGVLPYDEKGDIGNKAKENHADYKLAFPDTIVLNSMNILIGAVGISKYFGCVSPVYYVFKNHEDCDLRYINYVLSSISFQKFLRNYAKGILEIRLRVSAFDILKQKIPVPSLDEQIEIANYLDSKCAAIDQAITDKTQQIETLKAYKSSLIYEYVTGKKQVL